MGLEEEDAGQRGDELLVRLNTSLGTNKYGNSLSKYITWNGFKIIKKIIIKPLYV